jgi:hypothetical protein
VKRFLSLSRLTQLFSGSVKVPDFAGNILRQFVYWLSALLLLCSGNVYAVVSYQDVKARYLSSDAVLLDRHGVILQQMRVDARERKLAWVSLEDISLHSEAH